MDRAYDIVLVGATGFVGALTADYLARNAPEGCRWALAGRNAEALRALRSRLAETVPAAAGVPLLHVDVHDPATVRELAHSTRVLATTVGPYVQHGMGTVAACADAGTDYVDLTGEPEFVDIAYVRHHARALETGARLVHACGFDSVPHDLGVQFTVEQLPQGVPLRVDGYVRTSAAPSGGTLASTLTALSRGPQMVRAARDRRNVEPRPRARRISTRAGARFAPEVGAWALPLPTIDPQVVSRSAAALDSYGPDFRYRHYAAVRRLPVALGAVAGVAGVAAAAQLPAARRWISGRLAPGDGPSDERRARSWFSVRFVGEGGGRRVCTEVSGGDPGYDETAKILGESALSLAFDELPALAGQLTPAVAMGPALRARLLRAGLRFRVADRRGV
ncbi:saccharopine dehydrogenase family protein [Streptomyces sp. NBC_00932]|uniref:saccharopine dehydrogenase family protein n=1 Tax=Streptomyces sp. NBC_00932 TaxID=2903690 RepID=UPI0038648C73|nr:saccharopine dehydrogenase NADP-binding domain-containing protein [Streptomyces sp. NBC_00932]